MSLSRSASLFKNIKNISKINSQVRHGGGGEPWFYRTFPAAPNEVPKWAKVGRDCLMGLTFWWIMWKTYHEPGHLFGEYEYPDPSKWTDAELGIPPDDED